MAYSGNLSAEHGIKAGTGPERPEACVTRFVLWSVPRCPVREHGSRWGLRASSQPACPSAPPGSHPQRVRPVGVGRGLSIGIWEAPGVRLLISELEDKPSSGEAGVGWHALARPSE